MQHLVEVGRHRATDGSEQRSKPRLHEPSGTPGWHRTGISFTVILAKIGYGWGGVASSWVYVSISKLEAGSCNRN